MPNSKNVIPYGRMCHQCAKYGGPKAYVNHIATIHEKKGMLKGAGGIVLVELGIEAGILAWDHRYEIRDWTAEQYFKLKEAGGRFLTRIKKRFS